jgi:N6-L-threonylcarbamoyladenine synthase
MRILGIESSCDETAAAVIENTPNGGVTLLSNITATSAGLHARTGGVIPEDAARKQIQSILPVIELALRDAFQNKSLNPQSLLEKIDAIAITVGPGLIGSLLVGVETAKTLALTTGVPIIPVNHLVGHIYANWIEKMENRIPEFPALALVVSGGHTDLVLMKDHGHLEWIGGTRDDAAGEAFDKTARLLGFDYPGGPLLSKAADEYLNVNAGGNVRQQDLFPRPLMHDAGYDWSFSGLKTAVLREMKSLLGEKQNIKLADYQRIAKTLIVQKERNRLAAEIQEAIVDVLVTKTLRAVAQFRPKSLLLAGGVSANRRLREVMEYRIKTENLPVSFHVPEPILCTDNAAYIATCAYFNQHNVDWKSLDANPELTIMDSV